MAFGNAAQKDKRLKPLARGDMLGAFCLTEPHVGSEAGGLKTSAVKRRRPLRARRRQAVHHQRQERRRRDRHGGHRQGRRQEGHQRLHRADRRTRLRRRAVEEKLGQHASDTAQIVFENCRIPAENLLAEEGMGLKIALSGLEGGRIGIASQSVGMARAAFEAALAYSKERVAFGQPIFDHQAVQFRLAEMATQIEAARQLIWHAASLKDAGRAVPERSGDGQAQRQRDGRARVFGGDPGLRRLRLRERLPGRAHLPRRARVPDLPSRRRIRTSRPNGSRRWPPATARTVRWHAHAARRHVPGG